jgi:hypothetical protein
MERSINEKGLFAVKRGFVWVIATVRGCWSRRTYA